MKKLLIGALLCAVIPVAQAQETQPATGLLQLFSCTLNPGQDQADVFSLLEALRAQADSTDGTGPGIFLWLPFRGATEYDYIWGATNPDLVTAMDGLSSYLASDGARALQPRFQTVNARCDTMIAMTEQAHASSEAFDPANAGDRMPDGLVETFVCNNRNGADMDDVRSATRTWQSAMSKIKSADMARYNGYLVMPFRGGTGAGEWGWIGTFPDMGSFGRGMTDYMNAKEGQAADAQFEKISSCRSALWTGYWLRLPAAAGAE